MTKINHLLEQYSQVNAHPTDTPMVPGLQPHQPDKSVPIPYDVTNGWSKPLIALLLEVSCTLLLQCNPIFPMLLAGSHLFLVAIDTSTGMLPFESCIT